MEPKERPLVCLASKVRLFEYNVGCCSNLDFCNENLTVELVPKTVDADDSMPLGGEFMFLNFFYNFDLFSFLLILSS